MKKIYLIAGLLLNLFLVSAYAQDFSAARRMCENYGFVPNTAPFAQCVQTEINKSKDSVLEEKQNEACLQRRQEIEYQLPRCGLRCTANNININAQIACRNECRNKAEALMPICREP